MVEIWKPIPRWEGMYEVSNLGRVRSVDRAIVLNNQFGPCVKRVKGTVLKHKIDKYGYPCLSLSKGGAHKSYTIHHLVAITFIAEYDGTKYQVNHIDGNKMNNIVANLEIVTPQANVVHAYANNLNMSYGERHPLAKLSNNDILKIRELYCTGLYSRPEIGAMFGVSASCISRIVTGEARYCKNNNLPPIKMKKWKKSKCAFTPKEIDTIRNEYITTKCSYAFLGRKYGVSSCTISRLIRLPGYGINQIADYEG